MNRLRRKERDKADAVLVTVIIAIPFFLAAFMFSAGMAQNGWNKASLSDSAQASAQKAAGAVNGGGNLDQNSVNTFVTEYMHLTDRQGRGIGPSGDYRTQETNGNMCSTVEINGRSYATPYIQLRLDKTRATGTSSSSPTYVSVGGAAASAVSTPNTRASYRVLSATVYESSRSLLGDGFALVGKKSGCYTSKIEVSGITFGSNSDLGG